MRWGYCRTKSTLRLTKAVSLKQREGQSHRRGRNRIMPWRTLKTGLLGQRNVSEKLMTCTVHKALEHPLLL